MSDVDDLAAFAVLIDAGSFTQGAARLGCSKGQLSKRISQLESTYNVVLLHRSTRRISLTAAGVELLPEAQALQAHVHRAQQALARLKDELAGLVRVTVPVSLGEVLFDGLLLEFSREYPQVQVELDLFNGYRDLRSEGFDLAVRGNVEADQRLVARVLLDLQELTCASPAYLQAHGEPLAPEELAGHRCLLHSHYADRKEWLYHRHHELIRAPVSGPLASNHYSLLKKAVLADAGIARLPSYMLHQELADGRLCWLLRGYQTPRTPLYLAHPYQGGLPRRAQVLSDYVFSWFQRNTAALAELPN